jgi:hypothetical protein
MRRSINESSLRRTVSRILREDDTQPQTKTMTMTVRSYQEVLAKIIAGCKSNPQTCAKTVDVTFKNDIGDIDRPNIQKIVDQMSQPSSLSNKLNQK